MILFAQLKLAQLERMDRILADEQFVLQANWQQLHRDQRRVEVQGQDVAALLRLARKDPSRITPEQLEAVASSAAYGVPSQGPLVRLMPPSPRNPSDGTFISL